MDMTIEPSTTGVANPGSAPARTGRRRRTVIGVLIGLPVAAIGCVMIVAGLALRTPSWYALPQVTEPDRQRVRNNLLAAEQAMTESLRRGQTFVYQLHQDDLNRWLIMRREIYPLADEYTPPELTDPFVAFSPGRITLAGRIRYDRWNLLASIDFRHEFRDGRIVLTADKARCGSVAVPVRYLGLPLDHAIDNRPGRTWPGSPRIWGDLLNGLNVGAKAWWKNGGMDYEVLNAWTEEGVLKFEIRPLGAHFADKASIQD